MFFEESIQTSFHELGLLKFEILATGLRVSYSAREKLVNAKHPIRTRSGTSGGLDIILPLNIYVNAPVDEDFSNQSHLLLDFIENNLVLRRNNLILSPVLLQANPHYYSLFTSDGVPMVKVGQMCSGDRFCYGMTGPYCRFWPMDDRCQYCSIGYNSSRDATKKTLGQFLETLRMAINDPLLPAKHVLIGGGTPNSDDMGAIMASELCRAIKKEFDVSCYVMICAPLRDEYIRMVYDSGADELGMNIEFYSDLAWNTWIPGKQRIIGKRRYLEALEYAVSLFGPINTRSIMVVGLEDKEFTLQGAETLASMGVMPILSPFRPLKGTALESKRGFDQETYWEIYNNIHTRIARFNIPTGPTCICCQNNTLALPLPQGPYRFY